jgi:hypothetical protein
VVWQPKLSAPLSFDLRDAFAALITGDATWGWLANYLPMLDENHFDTTSFCSAGPSGADALDVSDFNTGSRSPIGTWIQNIGLVLKLRSVAYDRIFSAYCENVVVGSGETCDLIASGSYTGGAINNTGFFGQTAFPAGTTRFRISNVHTGSGQISLQFFAYNSGGDLGQYDFVKARVNDGVDGYFDKQFPTSTIIGCNLDTNDIGGHASADVYACYPAATTTTDFTPAVQAEPDNVIPPSTKTYTSYQDLGDELDALEFKAAIIQQHLEYLTQFAAPALNIADDPVAVDPDAPVSLVGAIGFLVTVSGIPSGSDELFGIPPKYHRLGRVTIGTDLGWFPSIDLTHSPLLIAPLPPGAHVCQVSVYPPATATVTVLRPPK